RAASDAPPSPARARARAPATRASAPLRRDNARATAARARAAPPTHRSDTRRGVAEARAAPTAGGAAPGGAATIGRTPAAAERPGGIAMDQVGELVREHALLLVGA